MQIQFNDCLIIGISIPNSERELIRKTKISLQDIKAACINYETMNEINF